MLKSDWRGSSRDRFIRLTEAGRVAALGGRDPEIEWARSWDGRWRVIVFDLPHYERTLRKRIDRALLACGCGHLQGSVWITPMVPNAARKAFKEKGEDCAHLMFLDTVSMGRSMNRKLVRAAWDFNEINALYEQQMAVAEAPPPPDASRQVWLQWIEREHESWLTAVQRDPLLPARLHPAGYLGVKAWRRRRRTLRRATPFVL